ncbi:MAG TPA: glycosyltransferase family A protein [Cyclobacteriaceae bacterium]|nr:glycosyltransferase family A protein [Cyclobacteriaceae bacterium]
MTSSPAISVIMPAYNCGPYIAKAINSILEQTFQDFELLICDDASTDNTWSVIDGFTDKRVRKFRHEVNKGGLATYNDLLQFTTGTFVTIQDSDDWAHEQRLQLQYDVFQRFPDVGLCYTNGVLYYSETLYKDYAPFKQGYITITDPFPKIAASIMFRREVLKKVPGFNSYFDRLTAWDEHFIMEILFHFKGYALNRYLYFIRFRSESNHRSLNHQRKLTVHEAFELLKKQRIETGSDWLMENKQDKLLEFEKSLLKNRKFIAEKYREHAVYQIDAGKVSGAMSLLAKSFWLNPLSSITYQTFFYGLRKMLLGG